MPAANDKDGFSRRTDDELPDETYMTAYADGSELDLEALVEFADNPEPRCACVLLLDVSGSMHGEPISALNQGVSTYIEALRG